MEATHILFRAESSKVEGKQPEDEGRSIYRKRATSAARTVDRTSRRRESRRDRTRLPRAVMPWPPRNTKALDQKSINRSKLPHTSSVR